MNDLYKGYKGRALDILKKYEVRVWSEVSIKTTRGGFDGIILPRSEYDDDIHLVLKLGNGYNVGIDIQTITHIKELGYKEAHYKIPEKEFPVSEDKPNVKLFGTGGTIASRLDYRTGAVIPAFSPGELYGAVPELADICNLTTEKLFSVFSENMGPDQYKTLAIAIGEEIRQGIDGIVIGQYHASYRFGTGLHDTEFTGSHCHGWIPAIIRPALLGCSSKFDPCHYHCQPIRYCRGHGLYVWHHFG
jgi:glutamyl-tRNA(Gln) amidotransferase subunit D